MEEMHHCILEKCCNYTH